jgi:hypothetical protein
VSAKAWAKASSTGMHSIKIGLRVKTYAQKICCGTARRPALDGNRYQSHSAAKWLIYIASLNCFFCGHFNESLANQGFQAIRGKLSTKLSTENLEIFKASLNQALSAVFTCFSEDSPTIPYTS